MTLTIIAGTHTFVDLTGKFRLAWARSQQKRIFYDINGVKFAKRRFDRVEIQTDGSVVFFPSRIFPMDRYGIQWSVSQPTGSGKTILAVYHLRKTFRNGGNIAANFSYKYFAHNLDKTPDKWLPNIVSIEDLQEIKNCHVVIDDIKGTIERWQAKEADIITLVANTGRKESVDLDFTTQRVINYMPPNIRAVATGYEIPYITIRDCRIPTPDNKGFPVEMEVFSAIPADSGDVFVGFGVLNKDIPDGKIICPTQELLNSYRTMELATGLKMDGKSSNRPGLEGEKKLLTYLQMHYPDIDFNLKNGKGVFDIESQHAYLDHVGIEEHGTGYRLNTRHKNISKHRDYSQLHKTPGYIVFEWNGDFRFLSILSPYTLSSNPMINTGMLKASRSRIAVFG